MERWKSIPIKNLKKYKISTHGRIKNSETGRILKQKITNGYYVVNLWDAKNEKTVSVTISRYVLITFKSCDKERNIVNHIDGDKLNNHISNLEWTTQKENINHAYDNNLVQINKKAVIKLDKSGKELECFNSIKLASESIGLTRHAIIRVLKGKNQTAGGYCWKYADERENKECAFDDTEFKVINGYEKYYVSKNGDIYSSTTNKILKPVKNKSGYTYVTLSTSNKKKCNKYIHILVANAYIDNPDDKKYVNHKDKDRSNNKLSNLEWVTARENMIHANNN
jgi:hypothetical protein